MITAIAFASSVFNKEHYQAKTTLFFFRLDTNLCFITLKAILISVSGRDRYCTDLRRTSVATIS
ncbi:hypothetical protein T4C_11100, partial [Trichinella pseudospiralis]